VASLTTVQVFLTHAVRFEVSLSEARDVPLPWATLARSH